MYVVGSNLTDFISPLFYREKKQGYNVFARVRAGDLAGCDSLLPSATVVRGEGIEPRKGNPCYEVGESQLADSLHIIFCWLYRTTH